MKRLRHAITLASLVAVSVVGLYGCGGETPTATTVAPTATTVVEAPTATTAVEVATATTAASTSEATATTGTSTSGGGSGSATDLLKKSDEAMKSVKSFHIAMKIGAAGTSASAEGDYVVPDKAARLTMTTPAGNSNMIVIDNATYTQIPGSDAYIETTGISPLGTSADTAGYADLAQNATIVGDETLDGVDTTHVKFTYDADKAMAASGSTTNMNLGMVDAEVWIEKATNYYHQLKTTSTVAGTPSSTTITYSKFNEEVTPPIEKPTNIQQMPTIPTIPSP